MGLRGRADAVWLCLPAGRAQDDRRIVFRLWGRAAPAARKEAIRRHGWPRLAWLDSTLAERAASLPITEASPDVPAATYADWMAMEHRERIQNGNGKNGVAGDARRMLNLAGAQTSPAFHASLHGQLREALLALDELARAADALCGGQAPSFQALRDRLEHIDARVLAWHPSAGTDPPVSPPSSPASLSSPPPPSFSSREQAYASLSALADYLMRTEPHSPAPWLVKRAVSWGGHDAGGTARRVAGAGGKPCLHQEIARNDQRIAFFSAHAAKKRQGAYLWENRSRSGSAVRPPRVQITYDVEVGDAIRQEGTSLCHGHYGGSRG